MAAEASSPFFKLVGVSAILAAVVSVGYSITFALALRGAQGTELPSALLLMALGLLGIVVTVALYERLSNLDPGFALLGLVFGAVGGAGALIHGAHDLSRLVGPEQVPGGPVNPVDPRGVLTFGLTALAILVFARLMAAGTYFPARLKWVGYALGAFLMLVYLGRLLVLDPNQPMLQLSAVLTGFVLGPIWNLWIGVVLIRRR
jgi:hypothetical protein